MRIVGKQNLELICKIAVAIFWVVKHFYRCKCINYPKEKCVFALWHAHQCGVYSCNHNQDRKTIVMVSNSRDGEIISRAANSVGVETVRGSQNRDGAKASFEIIDKIVNEDYNGAITIDGPKGPKRIVKKGIIEIARKANVPIVPAIWWSPDKSFLKFKSWDEFRFPIFMPKLVMKFGDPIYIPQDIDKEDTEKIRKEIEDKLNELYKDVKENHKKYWKEG